MGPLIPFFWTSGDVSSWFQSQEWATLFTIGGGVPIIRSLRFISGATPADLLVVGMVHA